MSVEIGIGLVNGRAVTTFKGSDQDITPLTEGTADGASRMVVIDRQRIGQPTFLDLGFGLAADSAEIALLLTHRKNVIRSYTVVSGDILDAPLNDGLAMATCRAFFANEAGSAARKKLRIAPPAETFSAEAG